MENEPKIFLSHRAGDRKAADAIRKSLVGLGFSQEHIFDFTGGSQSDKVTVASNINQELARGCHDANLFILIYTVGDENWQYCMYEAGLATDAQQIAQGNAPDTRIVVFQCTDDIPTVFAGNLLVRCEEESLEEFLIQLSTRDDFVPGFKAKHARSPFFTQSVRSAAQTLLKELTDAVRHYKRNEIWRWDWFQLGLDAESVQHLSSAQPEAQNDLVMDHAMVFAGFGEALDHFDFNPAKIYDTTGRFLISNSDPESLRGLCRRWNARLGHESNQVPKWAAELINEITKSVTKSSATPQKQLMKSALSHRRQDWYYPVLNHVSQLPDGSVHFTVYMYRIARDFPWVDTAVLDAELGKDEPRS